MADVLVSLMAKGTMSFAYSLAFCIAVNDIQW